MVVINIRDYENMVENLYITQNPYLMDKLRCGVAQVARARQSLHALADEGGDGQAVHR